MVSGSGGTWAFGGDVVPSRIKVFFFFLTSCSVLPFFSISSKASGALCLFQLYFVKADDGFDLRLDQFWTSLRVNGDVGAPHLNVGLS